MNFKSPHKVNQQHRIVLLALYLVKNRFGDNRPPKRKILRAIRSLKLMHVPAEDEAARSNGDAIWENDLAWKRENLKEGGFVRMPEHGVWQITEYGEREVEAWAQRVKEVTEKKKDWVADFKAHSDPKTKFDDEIHYEHYYTEDTVRWALKIATRTLI